MATIADRIKEGLSIRKMRQADLVYKTGIGKSSISTYISGDYEPKQRNIYKIAKALDVSEAWLMGYDVPMERTDPYSGPSPVPPGFEPIPKMQRVPLVGQIACGQPITAEENLEGYIEAPAEKQIDFALTCRGDSMIDAGIHDGDIAYIRKQPQVENGQIAAVRIGTEATLKRVYYYPAEKKIILQPANSAYPPLSYTGEELNEIVIEGLLVGYTHWMTQK